MARRAGVIIRSFWRKTGHPAIPGMTATDIIEGASHLQYGTRRISRWQTGFGTDRGGSQVLEAQEAFAEKNAKKYGSIEEAKAVFDHWS